LYTCVRKITKLFLHFARKARKIVISLQQYDLSPQKFLQDAEHASQVHQDGGLPIC